MRAPNGTDPAERFAQAAALLPHELRQGLERLPEWDKAQAEEFRLRVGRPPMVSWPEGERPIPGCENRPICPADLGLALEVASQASAHTVLDRVRDGFVTIRGGHRIGLCGSGVMDHGELHNLRQLSSMAIRIAHEVWGAAEEVLPQLLSQGQLQSAILLSPPGGGKTTLLRDIIRRVSDGVGVAPLRVGVADERGELAAVYDGMPMNDVGLRTDVMDGCPKGPALLMLLRGMNPQVLAADEITAREDAEALEQATGCGVILLCTAHGGAVEDLYRRPLYRRMVENGTFQKVVLIEVRNGKRRYRVESLERGLRC